MDLDSALAAHQEWKIKLRGAIAGKTKLDAQTISRDDCCPFGKWLHGEAKIRYAAMPAYLECLESHALFHKEAGKVAALINHHAYDQAEKALSAGTPYSAASDKVGGAIIRIRHKIATFKSS